MSEMALDLLELAYANQGLALAALLVARWGAVRLLWPGARWAARLPVRGYRWATARQPHVYSDLACALVEELGQKGLKVHPAVMTGLNVGDWLHTPGGLRVRIGTDGTVCEANRVAGENIQALLPLLERNGKRDVALVQQAARDARTRAKEEGHAAACKAAVEALTAPRREEQNPAPSPPDTPPQSRPAEADLVREAQALGYEAVPCLNCRKRTVLRRGQHYKCNSCGIESSTCKAKHIDVKSP